jgi:hypothetical protein
MSYKIQILRRAQKELAQVSKEGYERIKPDPAKIYFYTLLDEFF